MNDKNGDAVQINRFNKKRFALLLVIAVALVANLLLDPGLYWRYGSPMVCSDKDRIHLVFTKKYPFQKKSSFIYSTRSANGEWQEQKEFTGNPLAVACFNGQLVIFYEGSCSIYEEGERKGNAGWDYAWRVSDAAQCGDSLLAFGSQGGTSSEDGSSISVARYDGEGWTELSRSPEVAGAVSDLQAASLGGLVALFWRGGAEGKEHQKRDNALRYMLFDPEKAAQGDSSWIGPRELRLLTGQIERFTVCANGDRAWIFSSAKGGKLSLARIRLDDLVAGAKVSESPSLKRKKAGAMASCQLQGDVLLFVSNGAVEEAVFPRDGNGAAFARPRFRDVLDTDVTETTREIAWIISAAFALIVLTTASISILKGADARRPPVGEGEQRRVELAPVGRRALAYCFDAFALLPAILAVGLIMASEYIGDGGSGSAGVTSEDLTLSTSLVGAVLSFLYFTICEGKWGQTLGKRMLGIAVAREDGKELRFRDAVVRNLLRVVDEGLFMIGLLFILNTRKFQRIGDLVAGTVVVKREIGTNGLHRRTD